MAIRDGLRRLPRTDVGGPIAGPVHGSRPIVMNCTTPPLMPLRRRAAGGLSYFARDSGELSSAPQPTGTGPSR
jgi:hypothetical protein